MFGKGNHGTHQFTWTSELNQIYPVWIRHRDAGRPSNLVFNWTYPQRTCDGVVVPAYSGLINDTSWSSGITPLGSIPYNVTVT